MSDKEAQSETVAEKIGRTFGRGGSKLGFRTPEHLPSPTCYGPPVTRAEMRQGFRVLAKAKRA